MTSRTATPPARSGGAVTPRLRRRVPEQELPYDDEPARDAGPSASSSPADTVPRELGAGLVVPTAGLANLRQRSHHDTATTLAARGREAGRSVDGRDGRFHPVPRPAAAVVTRALLEVVCGQRPAAQLSGWTTPQLQAELARVSGTVPTRRRYVVKSIRVAEPRPGVAEIVAVVTRGDRAAAVALRMESASGRWRVTRFEMG